ncbi:uncharacterized protein BDR25DRAFT_302519 [Lindgomyces ingoldianus]|uniref:Uncharacterized protein n=1 Tax=Lindgomyces ingoldianus TaxID=673940 RepID=A0ACB6R0V4_9PLEO|nr:uncharacterized protein BDR25DRAFT_302519 [Lindgomyces ingoldianus]KAF2472939.1 hypothetical protein BDR25DRAFT_302519 [Lindgomyces ingoldianus]
MHFTSTILLALPFLAAAALRPAKFYGNLVARDDYSDALHSMCAVGDGAPKDCGMGYCCYYYEECRDGTDGQAYPFCMDISETSTGGEPFSVVALQFATTGIPSNHASPTAHPSSNAPTTHSAGPTATTGTAAAASTTGAASNNKVGAVFGLGMLAGFAGMLA